MISLGSNRHRFGRRPNSIEVEPVQVESEVGLDRMRKLQGNFPQRALFCHKCTRFELRGYPLLGESILVLPLSHNELRFLIAKRSMFGNISDPNESYISFFARLCGEAIFWFRKFAHSTIGHFVFERTLVSRYLSPLRLYSPLSAIFSFATTSPSRRLEILHRFSPPAAAQVFGDLGLHSRQVASLDGGGVALPGRSRRSPL